MMSDVAVQMKNLQAGDHLCLFYEQDAAEQMMALVPFIREALDHNERFIYVADDQTIDELWRLLEQNGVDVRKETSAGRLLLWTRAEWRDPAGLDSERKASHLVEVVESGIRAGYKGVSIAVEMTWTLGPEIQVEQLEHWEATINRIFLPGFPGKIVCQYNRSRLSAEAMLAALHTHPLAILEKDVCPNVFYEAPLILNKGGRATTTDRVDWMVAQLRRARIAELEREHQARRRRTDTELALQYAVNKVLLDSSTYLHAAAGLLKVIGEHLGWTLGSLWQQTVATTDLQCVETWHAPASGLGELARHMRDAAPFPPGVDIPGETWRNAEPLWVADLQTLPETPRLREASRAGLRSALAVPIKGDDGVSAVIELMSDQPRQREDEVVGLLLSIGSQFGQFIARKRAEESLRRLAAIVESSDDAILSKDLNGIITSWNKGAERLFGYTSQETVGRSVTLLMPPERYNEEPGILARIRRGERIEHYSTIRQRKDGSLVPISLTVSPLKDADGRIVGASKIARDISVLRRIEEALSQSESKFRTLADNIVQFAWMADENGEIVWYNRRWLEYTGTTFEEMRADGWSKVLHPDHCDRVQRKVQRHFETGETWEDTFPLRGKTGGYRWFLSRAVPLRDETGRIVRWFGTHTDVTDLREAEKALAMHARRADVLSRTAARLLRAESPRTLLGPIFRRVAHELGAEVYLNHLVGEDGATLVLESSAGLNENQRQPFLRYAFGEDLCGLVAERRDVIVMDNLQETSDAASASLRALGTRAFACFPMQAGVRLLGTLAFASRSRVRFDREELRFMHTACDLVAATMERAELLEEVKHARDAAESASRAKDDFMARLSHELRTPLNPVLLVASEAVANPDLPPAIRADFDVIAKSAALEARLIDDLLDLTRISRGKLSLDLQPQDLHTVLLEAVATVRPELEQNGIALELDLEAEHRTVLGDAVRLQQVFWNVLKNAAKFTPSGGKVSIVTRSHAERGKVSVRITDTGIGMTPREISRVFEAFSQGDHAADGTTSFGGLGLGLAISKMLVELHSGSIRPASRGRGKGAMFVIELPLVHVSESKSVPSTRMPDDGDGDPESKAVAAAATAFGGKRILLVEDHEPTRRTLAQLLVRRGHVVSTAGCVSEARALAERDSFDILLSDIGLPDGSGYDLMSELRAAQSVRGIALTGYGMEQDISRSRSAGFSVHLTKPVRVQSLDEALALVIHGNGVFPGQADPSGTAGTTRPKGGQCADGLEASPAAI